MNSSNQPSPWTKGLNPEQAMAVQHNEGPLLILAGAGSGKTTVLVARAGRLVAEGVCRPEELTVLTFTNKAARELKHRVQIRLGRVAKKIWAGTFHSFGLQLVKKYHKQLGLPSSPTIMDQSDSQSMIKDLLRDLTVAGKDKFAVEKLLNLVNEKRAFPKKTLVAEEEYLAVADWLVPRYEKRMSLLGAVDFESLLLLPLRLLREHLDIRLEVQKHTRFMMVDEFQDTNALQMELIELLVRPQDNLAVVGDDDQSIYGWRGAIIQNILDFPRQFSQYKKCQVVKLERNYRSTPAIVAVANSVIEKNDHRHGKVLRAQESEETPLPEIFQCESDDEECDFVVHQVRHFIGLGYKASDIAVLFRSNGQGALLEGTLRRHQIKYKITGSSTLFDRREVKDGLAFIRSAIAPTDFAIKRILNVPPRGLGDAVLEALNDRVAETGKDLFSIAQTDVESLSIKANARESLIERFRQLDEFARKLIDTKSSLTPGQELEEFLRGIGYRQELLDRSPEAQAAERRWTLIAILGRILDGFVQKGERSLTTLIEFLEAMELRDFDSNEEDHEEIQLLTMHASKGLEYPIVLIIGVEEDLIPHRVLGSDINEERRLFYVAVTRAKKHLLLSRCLKRERYGRPQSVAPSRFLLEIPSDLYIQYDSMYRPVSGEARQTLVSDFMSKLRDRQQTKNPPAK
jgi:DNA helicase-2/ATP-dependent DNA helicase PcrA